MDALLRDIRYALRSWRRTPGPIVAALAALALGIGATTTVFSVVAGVLLRSLPYQNPERLVMVWQDLRARGGPPRDWISPGLFVEWRQRATMFDELAAIRGWAPNLTGVDEPERLRGAAVSAAYFAALGVSPAYGRAFTEADDQPNGAPVAIISDALWGRLFNRDPGLVGRAVQLDGQATTVIGIMPSAFQPAIIDADIWTPIRIDPRERTARHRHPARARPNEAGRDGGAGAGGDGGHRAPAGTGGPGMGACARRRRSPARRHRRRRPADADRPVGGGRAGAGHRLRQRHEPPAGPGGGPEPGGHHPRGARRRPRTDRQAAADRERPADRRRRRRRTPARVVGPARPAGAGATLGSTAARGAHRRSRARVHGRRHARHGRALRHGAGPGGARASASAEGCATAAARRPGPAAPAPDWSSPRSRWRSSWWWAPPC